MIACRNIIPLQEYDRLSNDTSIFKEYKFLSIGKFTTLKILFQIQVSQSLEMALKSPPAFESILRAIW
ncbi:MAG TPA: hypothetical protein DCY24_02355 [Rikenellaceae bacterium]|nr:hypothetical protein [Rikenellaceae bacterium]